MKPLFVITSLDLGGAQTFLYRLIESLNGSGVAREFTILSLKPFSRHSTRFRNLPGVTLGTLGMKNQLDYIVGFSRMKDTIAEIAARSGTTAIHGILWHANRLVAALPRVIPRIVNIRHWHGMRHLYDLSELQSATRADAAITNNLHALERLIKVNKKTRFLPNMMPDPLMALNESLDSPRPFRWINPARFLFREKKQNVLLEAFLLSLQEFPDQELVFAGEGPDESSLRNLIRKRGLGGRVRILPAAEYEWKAASEYDAAVLASVYEGFPNVLVETAAVETPIILSESVALGAGLEPGDAATVSPMKPEPLAGRMRELIRNYPAEKDRTIRLKRKLSETCSRDAIVRAFAESTILAAAR